MSYIFYRDKDNVFEANVKVDGASLSDTRARLILTFENGLTTLYEGKVKISGDCEIKIPAIKDKLTESETGKAVLEVIAESTVFEPWTSDFSLKRSKTVTVEVVDKATKPVKPRLTVEVKKQKVDPDIDLLGKLKIRLAELSKSDLKDLLVEYKETGLSKGAEKWIAKVMPNDTSKSAKLVGKIYELLK